MKKLFAVALLALVSSFAFAASPSGYDDSKRVNALYDTSAPTMNTPVVDQDVKQAAPAETGSSLEKGASKLGSMFGSLFKAPVNAAKAFGKGMSQAMSGNSADTTAQASSESAHAEKSASASVSHDNARSAESFASGPLAVVAAMVKRAKNEQAALVEERSSYASSKSY